MKSNGHILVLGASGWIGSHLVRLLVESTTHVIECWVRRESTVPILRKIGGEERLVIRCASDIKDLTLSPPTSVVIHCASPTNHWEVAGTFDANLRLTWHLLDQLSGRGVSTRFVYLSTLLIRGNSPHTFSENDLDVGQDFLTPYAQAKFLAETLLRTSYIRDVETTSLRLGSVLWPFVSGVLPRRNWVCQAVRFWQQGQLPIIPLPENHLFYPIPVDELCTLIYHAAIASDVPRVLHIPAEPGPSLGSVFAGLSRKFDCCPPRFCSSDSEDWMIYLESLPSSTLKRRLKALFPVPPRGAVLSDVKAQRSQEWIDSRGLVFSSLTDTYWQRVFCCE